MISFDTMQNHLGQSLNKEWSKLGWPVGIPGRDLLIGLIKVRKFTPKRGVPFYGLGPVLIQGKNNPNTSVSYILVSFVTIGCE